ncbi:helix-turn-helix domain-containing protein [Gordonia sp. ABSL11-1]|uniref:helix-turn-helix domain-containing protein n=1 Tax=Gordonia sp. ABSL11-1 TaxID=3053924 RepID=UPI002572CDF7|nr:helix-turn-helix domain-containing protein [Gordonia sp. ABSL11-1]MDL9949031.1 helix-turn-helix domain-containing protein [Gordonia sp. ABSL11-1]
MVTVEVDPARVESRLLSGDLACPSCPSGVLGGWGHARPRRIVGAPGPIRPRRSRCRGCAATHVLLPVVLLLRRAYLGELIYEALQSAAAGSGHRSIGAALGVPATTVRGWIRVLASRAGAVRNHFLTIAVATGVEVHVPKATGSRCGDALAAIGAAHSAVGSRFGADSVGAVTAAGVSVALSGGRLLAPGWPAGCALADPTPVASACAG